ncbi:MAG: hypothetical protein R3C05_18385 [Pirellulaceae bacterium]
MSDKFFSDNETGEYPMTNEPGLLSDEEAIQAMRKYCETIDPEDAEVARQQMRHAIELVDSEELDRLGVTSETEVSVRVRRHASVERVPTSEPNDASEPIRGGIDSSEMASPGENDSAARTNSFAKSPVWTRWSVLLSQVVALLIGCLITYAMVASISPTIPSGRIESPQESAIVADQFEVKGRVVSLQKNHSVFLVVEVGDLMWPKRELNVDENGNWQTTLQSEQVDFRISILAAGPEIAEAIRKDVQSREVPGRAGFRGTVLLDWVQLQTVD